MKLTCQVTVSSTSGVYSSTASLLLLLVLLLLATTAAADVTDEGLEGRRRAKEGREGSRLVSLLFLLFRRCFSGAVRLHSLLLLNCHPRTETPSSHPNGPYPHSSLPHFRLPFLKCNLDLALRTRPRTHRKTANVRETLDSLYEFVLLVD